jgi:hypothetical protein
MNSRNRREFLSEVGRSMLVASLGSTASIELGITPCIAEAPNKRLTFGKLEPLVTLMQETPPDKLLQRLVSQLKSGTQLRTLVSAAALANARAFGGQDYTGYHTFMALMPAYRMTSELPVDRRALPVLKVLYRNSSRMQEQHVEHHDTLHPIDATGSTESGNVVKSCAMPFALSIGMEPKPNSPRSPIGSRYRLLINCNMRFRMRRTCIVWCWPGGPGPCWNSLVKKTRRLYFASRFASALTRSNSYATST